MTLKILYYLFFSIVAVGIYHCAQQWLQDSFSYYFSFSKVKKTDKLFELVEKSNQEKEESDGSDGSVEKEAEEKGSEEKGEEEMEVGEQDLFQFIDGL
jgi:hypothetical protein